MNEITIFDEIGGDSNIVTTLAIQEQLKKIGKVDELLVRINSPGGDVSEGIGIFHVLKNFDAKIVCRIEGIAASAASLIAMAGDRIEMCTGTFLLIHEPHAETIGPSSELTALASDLEKMTKSFAEIYALRSGQSEDFVEQLMAEDRLMSAEEALSLGFCDEIIKNVQAKINMKCLPRFLQRAVKKAKMEKAKMARTRMDTDNSDNQNTDTDERLDNIEKKIEELTARMDADEDDPDLKPKARGKARGRADDDDDDKIDADDDDEKIDADDDDDKIDADDDDDDDNDKIDADDDDDDGTKTVSRARARAKKMSARAAYIRGFKRAKKIIALCTLAGCPEKADKYLSDGMSVTSVSKALLAQKKSDQNITNIRAYKSSAMTDAEVEASWATAIKKISK
ncbi:Clp protease ClpP [Bartonella apihabitans]|nr:head maturation protease, ClpP-related [Bartonella apihabitans]WLT09640.1 Clp protease ClpP [Bartonella apihabitans]